MSASKDPRAAKSYSKKGQYRQNEWEVKKHMKLKEKEKHVTEKKQVQMAKQKAKWVEPRVIPTHDASEAIQALLRKPNSQCGDSVPS